MAGLQRPIIFLLGQNSKKRLIKPPYCGHFLGAQFYTESALLPCQTLEGAPTHSVCTAPWLCDQLHCCKYADVNAVLWKGNMHCRDQKKSELLITLTTSLDKLESTVFPRMLTADTISFRLREAANTKWGRIEHEGECNIS